MAFRVVTPAASCFPKRLEDHEVSLGKSGCLALTRKTAERHRLGDRITVLVDDLNRVALRPPEKGEDTFALRPFNFTGKKAKVPEARRSRLLVVNLRPALRELGLDAKRIAGRRRWETKNDLLVVALAPPRPGDK